MADPALISNLQVSYVVESTRGTTPTINSGNKMINIPIIQGSRASLNKNFERSNVLRPDRQGGQQIGGTRFGLWPSSRQQQQRWTR